MEQATLRCLLGAPVPPWSLCGLSVCLPCSPCQVTDLAFVERGGRRLVSCSKDEHVKVWDLDTQHCCQTVVGHRCERAGGAQGVDGTWAAAAGWVAEAAGAAAPWLGTSQFRWSRS